MEKVLRVGVMPGRITEVAVETGSTIAEVLAIAGLSSDGYEIKVDGAVSKLEATVGESTNLVLLAKQVKGNAGGLVRIGVMPGRINEFAVSTGKTVGEALEIAGLDADGYEVKIDGQTGDVSTVITENTNLILLAKQVKGNRVAR